MKKSIYAITLLFIFSVLVPPGVFAEQIATTQNGREVLLRDNNIWEYAIKDSGSDEVIAIRTNEEVSDVLHYHIQRSDGIFLELFKIEIDWGLPYDMKYKHILENLHHVSQRRSPERFFNELTSAFGIKTAENIKWLIEHWGLWEKFCR